MILALGLRPRNALRVMPAGRPASQALAASLDQAS
jgi:hypothetical protein